MAFGGAGPTHANLPRRGGRPRHRRGAAGAGDVLRPRRDSRRRQARLTCARTVSGSPAVRRSRRSWPPYSAPLEDSASSWIRSEGDMLGEVVFDASLDMRYTGQAFDLQVPIPEELRAAPDLGAITELFHREHERIYSFRDPESSVEVSTERVRVTGRIPPLELPPVPERGPAEPFDTRRVYVAGRRLDVARPCAPRARPRCLHPRARDHRAGGLHGVGAPRLERGRPSDRQPPDPAVEGSGRRTRALGARAAESRGGACVAPTVPQKDSRPYSSRIAFCGADLLGDFNLVGSRPSPHTRRKPSTVYEIGVSPGRGTELDEGGGPRSSIPSPALVGRWIGAVPRCCQTRGHPRR